MKALWIRFLEGCRPPAGINHGTLQINWWDKATHELFESARKRAKS